MSKRSTVFAIGAVFLGVLPMGTAAETNAPPRQASASPAKITAESTYYDRKEGFAIFSGRVQVTDADYQLHADRAYVFVDGSNQLHRVVALGSVALTNGLRRAYGIKASYYKQSGMVVLYGSETRLAEVRDVSKGQDQVVTGSKIRLWINSEQVEVLDAEIRTPRQDAGAFGSNVMKNL